MHYVLKPNTSARGAGPRGGTFRELKHALRLPAQTVVTAGGHIHHVDSLASLAHCARKPGEHPRDTTACLPTSASPPPECITRVPPC
jgi:hypothetical protein